MPCRVKQACKPNFVFALQANGNHSSRLFVTEKLKRPTRKRRLNCFGQMSGQLIKNVSLFDLAPRGVYPAALVTKRADALLPRRFIHHPCPQQNPRTDYASNIGWFVFCCTCRRSNFSIQTPGRYPARRPLVFGLSSVVFQTKAITRLAPLQG